MDGGWAIPGADAVLVPQHSPQARRVKITRLTATQIIVEEPLNNGTGYVNVTRFRRPKVLSAGEGWQHYSEIIPADAWRPGATLVHPDSDSGVKHMAESDVLVKKARFRDLAHEFGNAPTAALQSSVQDAMLYLVRATQRLEDIIEEQERKKR